MYIKQIVIENFKSYHGRHVLEHLSPGHNAIVGHNGSGKSSLLECITFILSSRYCPITKSQRAAVINDDSQNRSLSASVELVLADPDGLLLLSTPEVRIRRVVFPDSDQITVNNVKYTWSELASLLSDVFPRENPYYIIRQDEVAQLATGKDSARFEVIATAVGVHKFQEGVADLLQDITAKLEIVENKEAELARQHSKLQEENSKYKRWVEIDKTKRYLELKLCELHQNTLTSELSSLQDPCEIECCRANDAQSNYTSLSDKHSTLAEEISALHDKIRHLEEAKKKLRNEDIEISKEVTSLDIDYRELIDKLRVLESGEVETFLQRQIKLQEELQKLKDRYTETEGRLRERQNIMEMSERELKRREYQTDGLKRKKMMVLGVQSDEDISNFTRTNSQFERSMNSEEETIINFEHDVKKAEHKKLMSESELHKYQNQLSAVRLQLRDQKREKESLESLRDALLAQKKEKQKEADKLQDNIQLLTKSFTTLKRRLQSVIRSEVFEGIESVRKIVDIWRDQDRVQDVTGVKGLLLEIFTCNNEMVKFSVEVKGRDLLFYHVVRDRQVISEILKDMKLHNLPGIVNFIPLEDISVPRFQYPLSKDCSPMVSHLTAEDGESQKAVDFVFGNTVIVRNLQAGISITRTYNLQSITMEGHQVLGKGRFRGGYRDKSLARVDLYMQFVESRENLTDAKKDYDDLMFSIRQMDQEILTAISELQKLELKIFDSEQHTCKLRIDIDKCWTELETATDALNTFKRLLEGSKVRLEETRREKLDVTFEKDQLEQTDVCDIDRSLGVLRDESISLRKQLKQAEDEAPQLEAELKALKTKLSRVQDDQHELEDKEKEFSVDFIRQQLELTSKRRDKCKTNLVTINERLKEIQTNVDDSMKQAPELEKALRETSLEREAARLTYEEMREAADLTKSKCQSLKQKISEWEQKAANLGTVPHVPNARDFEKLGRKGMEKKIRELKQKEERLGNVSEVRLILEDLEENVKIVETAKEQVRHAKRKYEKYSEIINREKVEALASGFDIINQHFGDIFGEIVHGGRASLYPVDERRREVRDVHWERVREIRMRASFVRGQQMDKMHQLSGGQKTVIALTLILAIHKYRPVPFYLFDEVDKALDARYRQAVAQFVHNLSRESQFLTVTFRGELLMTADKYFKVTARQDCAHVGDSSREEALKLVGGPEEE